MWIKKGDLEKRVTEDILWVRERFAYAGKEEPTDEDIMWWFDVQASDKSGTLGVGHHAESTGDTVILDDLEVTEERTTNKRVVKGECLHGKANKESDGISTEDDSSVDHQGQEF